MDQLHRRSAGDQLAFLPDAYAKGLMGRTEVQAEAAIEKELLREKALVEDPELPISVYNYSALPERLKKQGTAVSLYRVIDRAKELGSHQ